MSRHRERRRRRAGRAHRSAAQAAAASAIEQRIAFTRSLPEPERDRFLTHYLRAELVAEAAFALDIERRRDGRGAHRAAFLWLCLHTLRPYVAADVLSKAAAVRAARRAVHDAEVELVARPRREAAR